MAVYYGYYLVEYREVNSVIDVDGVISEDAVAEFILFAMEHEPPLSKADATPFLPRPDKKWLSLRDELWEKFGKR